MAQFRRNGNGDWVILGTVDEVIAGSKVAVKRRDDTVRSVFIASVGTPFAADGKMMVYGYIGTAPKKTPKVKVSTPKVDDAEYVNYGSPEESVVCESGDSVPF
jgi:hypothetical protein